MSRLAVLAVHYLLPELLADQVARISACAAPLRDRLGLDLDFHPRDEVVHAHGAEPLGEDGA
jgi:hypothetical protein